jgi:2-oxoglutarate ferredoxin oxidoreductase subunit alpha
MSEQADVRLMQGNEACAYAALLAGCRFFAGYPITPSSEIAEVLSREMPKVGGKFIQMEDEIASMAAIIGASLAGVKSLTATSGPGFSLKQENLGYASFTEVPCVIVNVMRGGPSTGLPTLASQADVMQAKWGSHGDHPVIALAPSSVNETIELTIRAFNLAEEYRVPVILLLDEVVGHMREKVVMPKPSDITLVERKKPTCPPEEYRPFESTPDLVPSLAVFGTGYRFHVTGLTHDEFGFPSNYPGEATAMLERLRNKLEHNKDKICTLRTFQCEDGPDILLISYGSSARVAKRAVIQAREEDIRAGMVQLITIWPFPDTQIEALCRSVKAVVVPELNQGQLICEIDRYVPTGVPVVGVNRFDGYLIEPSEILEVVKKVGKQACQ